MPSKLSAIGMRSGDLGGAACLGFAFGEWEWDWEWAGRHLVQEGISVR
jgi:hypothetical protein